jgi:sugar (pentulose or hexulose) kinase
LIDGWTIVLDIGKTHTKVSLHDEAGRLRSGDSYVNQARQGPGYPALDIVGIDEFLLGALAACAQSGPVRRIIPVAHGAALAIVQDGALACPPMDYESAIPESERSAYAAERDPFAATGSPLLPAALNAGLQLAHLESLRGPLSGNAKILTWPQYWAWRLCGVPACEVTSLGCHSDLWRPVERCYSSLVHRRGWMLRMARLSPAD